MDVSTVVSLDMARAKPKSQSFTVPSEARSTFCGFMSRWITFWECK